MAALPSLFAGTALLHTGLEALYTIESNGSFVDRSKGNSSKDAQLISAIELLWISIYCVKASFLAQLRFHKLPFAYVSVHLTRLYWVVVGICGTGLTFTLAVPIALCPTSSQCHYIHAHNTIAWETALTVIDIILDVSIVAVSLSVIRMANLPILHAAVNAAFKSLSILAVAFAITRLVILYTAGPTDLNYILLSFWLMIEAAGTITLASISVFRIVVLDSLTKDGAQALQLPELMQDDQRLVSRACGSSTKVSISPPNS
ncbi:hypothetical protein CC86DRAFT_284478 [Ophiobolus disseminans]|uniref:Integral membrane protein n=1 Tax=Ophiobolus disseminans TaxID=1469910 RepID=A0A6A7AC70_9PLEO|nr:hypothetical protein CC86DRAFT_284478 [Ophiobolus disseminans]